MSSGTRHIVFLFVVAGLMLLLACVGFDAGFKSGQLEAAKGNQMYELKPTFVEKGK